VLVGHSYAGSVITGAADRLSARIAALVYLDAFLPEDGDSCWKRQLPSYTVRPPVR
jgi:pimeloyl-ACP methyl ester carboxylesterase